MAVAASQRLMLQNVNGGNGSFYSSSMWYWIIVVLLSGLCSSFFRVTGFPAAFARAQAMALENGLPTASCVF